jgi:hypothetical protein
MQRHTWVMRAVLVPSISVVHAVRRRSWLTKARGAQNGQTALDMAVEKDYVDVAGLLRRAGVRACMHAFRALPRVGPAVGSCPQAHWLPFAFVLSHFLCATVPTSSPSVYSLLALRCLPAAPLCF